MSRRIEIAVFFILRIKLLLSREKNHVEMPVIRVKRIFVFRAVSYIVTAYTFPHNENFRQKRQKCIRCFKHKNGGINFASKDNKIINT